MLIFSSYFSFSKLIARLPQALRCKSHSLLVRLYDDRMRPQKKRDRQKEVFSAYSLSRYPGYRLTGSFLTYSDSRLCS